MRVPRLVVAGASSGVGKTSIACSIIHALRQRGAAVVRPFKVGPDYIDPIYLGAAARGEAYNLDAWLMGRGRLLGSFAEHSRSADVSVVEGVMGYYDGHSAASNTASTYHVATIIRSPVLLVIDASRAARSVAATALGFLTFQRDSRIAAVILNRLGSKRHARICSQALAQRGIRVAGCIPRDEFLGLKERHLGLHSTIDDKRLQRRLWEIAEAVVPHLDVEMICAMASSAGALPATGPAPVAVRGRPRRMAPASAAAVQDGGGLAGGQVDGDEKGGRKEAAATGATAGAMPKRRGGATTTTTTTAAAAAAGGGGAEDDDGAAAVAVVAAAAAAGEDDDDRPVIAVALDSSFNFYYQDNLSALRREGARLVFFSPVRDKALPACDGLYLGGGFPEVHAAMLGRNTGVRQSIRRLAQDGMPLYAECGGLMYLADHIVTDKKSKYKMVGLIDAQVVMTGRPVLNYTSGGISARTPITGPPRRFRGHEFHYSRMTGLPADTRFAMTLREGEGVGGGRDGIIQDNTLASYGHLYFDSSDYARRFVEGCGRYMRR